MKKLILLGLMLMLLAVPSVIATMPEMWVPPETICFNAHYEGGPIEFHLVKPGSKGDEWYQQFGPYKNGGNKSEINVINITEISELCLYASDSEACFSCVEEYNANLEMGREKQRKRVRNFEIMMWGFGILGGLIALGLFLYACKKTNLKEFFRFSWKKLGLSAALVVLFLIMGFFVLFISAKTYNPYRGYSIEFPLLILFLAIILIYGWPFILMLGLETLLFKNVDWIHAIDIPFIILALLTSIAYVYFLGCLIAWKLRKN